MKTIKEEDNEQEQWYKDAREQTLDTLPYFINHLLKDYQHDYGTICHALAAGAVATTRAMNHSDQGGMTGFQTGAIMWEYMEHWNNVKPPAKLVRYESMLDPQYDYKHEKTISSGTMDWLQNKAAEKLKERNLHPFLRIHLRSIVYGKVPFGYEIRDN